MAAPRERSSTGQPNSDAKEDWLGNPVYLQNRPVLDHYKAGEAVRWAFAIRSLSTINART
jgi:hypothetical protein